MTDHCGPVGLCLTVSAMVVSSINIRITDYIYVIFISSLCET